MMKALFLCLVVLALAAGGAVWVLMQPLLWKTHVATPPPVSAAALQHHVRMMSETFHPRTLRQPENLEAAASYIHDAFAASGAMVRSQTYTVRGQTVRNIIARYGAADGPVIVVGAHYDSEASSQTPGADDNASGVAGLLELARLLGDHSPVGAVELVAYTLEEPPFFATEAMGSAVHARSLRQAGQEVRLMLALEMIGLFEDAPGTQRYPVSALGLLYPDQGNFIALIGRVNESGITRTVKAIMRGASDLPVYSMNAIATIPGVDFSDHRNYWEQGYPALMVTDTAFYRNTRYHQPDDTADTLDYDRMSKVVQGVFSAVMRLSAEN